MKKLLLFTAAALALSGTALAADNWRVAGNFTYNDKAYTNPGAVSETNTAPLTYDEASGAYKVVISLTGTGSFKIVNLDQAAIDVVKDAYKADYSDWANNTCKGWHTQVGSTPDGGDLITYIGEDASSIQLTDFTTLNKATGHTPGFVKAPFTADNITVYWYPETKQVRVVGTPKAYAAYGITTDGTVAPTSTWTSTDGIYNGKYDFGTNESENSFVIRAGGNYPYYGYTTTDKDKVISSDNFIEKDGKLSYTTNLTPFHSYSEKRRNPGDPKTAASINVVMCNPVKTTLTGEYDVEFNALTGELTLSKAIEPTEKVVTWEVICVGTNNGAPIKFNPGQGVKMTLDETETAECYTCHIDVLNDFFKIVNDDQDIMDDVTANYDSSNTGKKASMWHTQYGANITPGQIVTLGGDAMELIDFRSLNKDGGHSPGNICFAGGVKSATDVTVKWYPESKKVKVSGTPSAYKDFGYSPKDNGYVTPKDDYLFTHQGNGIYTGKMTFNVPTEGLINYFKIRPADSTSPTYGFLDNDEETQYFGEPDDPAFKTLSATDNTKTYSAILTPYHSDQSTPRTPGDAFGSSLDPETISHTAKSSLVGTYDAEFDANTGKLTLTGDKSSTGVEELISDDYAPVEYYNLQGVKVENPSNGVYVRRQGNKVTKIVK